VADAVYGSAPNLAWPVEDKSIEPHTPVFDKPARKDGSFERADFVYDHEDDSYICPGRQPPQAGASQLQHTAQWRR
jgi:hypothetical protein